MSDMPLWLDLLVAMLLLSGAAFALIGSLGLLRLSEFMRRLHGPTKATTMGVGNILLAVILAEAWQMQEITLRELLISVFALATAPVSAMLLARAHLHSSSEQIPAQPPHHPLDRSQSAPPDQN
jgi:multicomponent K+:H+ antiporter subunit G